MRISRKAREATLRMLFQWELSKETPERVKHIYWAQVKGEAAVRQAAQELFDTVLGQREEIDRLIASHTEHWRLERLSAVDRNLMRLAVCEFLTRRDIPQKVVITEALEIAHRYSSDESARFINGVLDAIRRDLARRKEP